MIEIDEKYYLKICNLVPGLHWFLVKNNILTEYKIGISMWINDHPDDYPEIIIRLVNNPNEALTIVFGWMSCNGYLRNNGFKTINWSKFHDIFSSTYESICLKKIYEYKKIKII